MQLPGGGVKTRVVVLLALVLAMCWPGGASAAEPERRICRAEALSGSTGEASVLLNHDRRTFTKASSVLTLRVPRAWPHADKLLLGEGSEAYRKAMRCLIRGSHAHAERWDEWRPRNPVVTPVGNRGELKVIIASYGWIDQRRALQIGPWKISVGRAKWSIDFEPAATLGAVRWQKITVDPGAPGATNAFPEPDTAKGATALVWHGAGDRGAPDDVRVQLTPAWPRSWSAQDDNFPYSTANWGGGLLWQLALIATLWWAVVIFPQHGTPNPAEERVRSNLWLWSCTLLAVSVLAFGDNLYFSWSRILEDDTKWLEQTVYAPYGWITTAAAGALLLAFGRPSHRIFAFGAALIALTITPFLWTTTGGLSTAEFAQPTADLHPSLAAVLLASVCSSTLFLLGTVAAAWRLASDGGLFDFTNSELRLLPAVVGVAIAVAGIGTFYAVARELEWQRASWPSALINPGTDGYGAWHGVQLRLDLLWFSTHIQSWWMGKIWILSGLAILAVLRVRGTRVAPGVIARSMPQGVERLLLLAFFPCMVGMASGVYTNSGAAIWLWFFLYLTMPAIALRAVANHTVLSLRMAASGIPLASALAATDRKELVSKAGRYREIHAQLRRLDRGLADEENVKRRDLEPRLRALHRLHSPVRRRDLLPTGVSVVDAALSLGPRDNWWSNGARAARIAQWIALPFSAALIWQGMFYGDALTGTLHDNFGLPDALLEFAYWQVGYASAGFLLGAFWYQLPGRRGPTKAIPLSMAYVAPIGLFAVGNWALGEEQTNLALGSAAMLLVLTLTGIVTDLDTFRTERHFWQSRLELLLSVYQMRYFSLQMAWVLAQLAALATIWQFFDESAGPPVNSTDKIPSP
ncbi:DUF6185 family protein [Streptomyces sp. NPDC002187]|uniref:DUF6185 family protein n=1 Tax=Streptomyces sp. NPDC002187 TaxID=3364637 RepID=UPI0036BBC7EF